MIISGISKEQIEQALLNTNVFFDNNLISQIKPLSATRHNVTLRVKKSHGKGARISQTDGHAMVSACWHSYGKFIDNLFKYSNVKVRAQHKLYDKLNWEWSDYNIGSMMYPVLYSDCCRCKENGIAETIQSVDINYVNQKDLSAECWIVQIQGLSACEKCELKDTDKCGGINIRKTLKNDKGFIIPI